MTIQTLNQISSIPPERFSSGFAYMDELLGGGIIAGSTILFAGLPGAGKSSLLLQVSYEVAQGADKRVLYVAGEESKRQIKGRAERLAVNSDKIFLTNEPLVEDILTAIDETQPNLIIIDSVQMLHSNSMRTSPGTPSQIRYGLMTLCEVAQTKGITIVFVGHSTKGGYIAGLQTFQHMVDVTLYLGINEDNTRFLQVHKNRFGATGVTKSLYMSEYGIFDYPEEEKPFGAIKHITLTPEDIARKLEGSSARPFVLMILEWLKQEARKYPEMTNNGTTTLTSTQMEKLTENHPIWKPITKWAIKQIGT